MDILDEELRRSYIQLISTRAMRIQTVARICQFLGIASTCQAETEIPVETFKIYEKELAIALEKLSVCGLSTRNKESTEMQLHVAVKNRLSSLLSQEWCGRKLMGVGKRKDVSLSNGKRGKEYVNYKLQGPREVESLLEVLNTVGGDYSGGVSFDEVINIFGEVAI